MSNNKRKKWVDVPYYEGSYQITKNGYIRSLSRVCTKKDGTLMKVVGRKRTPHINTHGYLALSLYHNGVRKHEAIHRLLVMTFIYGGEIPTGVIVDHIDQIKTNNKLSNLRTTDLRVNRMNSDTLANNTSKCAGVFKQSGRKIWSVRISINNKSIFLGSKEKEVDASRLYVLAVENLNQFDGDNGKFRNLLNSMP